eukprot:g2833.t1
MALVPERICLFIDVSAEMAGLEFCRQTPRRFTRLDAAKTALQGLIHTKALLARGHEFCVCALEGNDVRVVQQPTPDPALACRALASLEVLEPEASPAAALAPAPSSPPAAPSAAKSASASAPASLARTTAIDDSATQPATANATGAAGGAAANAAANAADNDEVDIDIGLGGMSIAADGNVVGGGGDGSDDASGSTAADAGRRKLDATRAAALAAAPLDLREIFRVVYRLGKDLIDPHRASSDPALAHMLIRAVLVLGRSYQVPVNSMPAAHTQRLLEHPAIFFDALYLHASPALPGVKAQETFDFLSELEAECGAKRPSAYFFEASSSFTNVLQHAALLAAHATQRAEQPEALAALLGGE